VAYHIGQCLGRDPVRGHLDCSGQRRHFVQDIEPNPHRLSIGAPSELISSLLQGSHQSELIQRGRP
jgi:hypothetical protein